MIATAEQSVSSPAEIGNALCLLADEQIRPLLEEHRQPVQALEHGIQAIHSAIALPTRLKIGFVGEAQVGKSTLINALLGRAVLPTGGIGPLTAQATRVTYAETNAFRVTYHSAQTLNQLRFGVEQHLRRHPEAGLDIPDPIEGNEASDAEKSQLASDDASVAEVMLAQARRIVTGPEDVDGSPVDLPNVVVLDAIRTVLGQRPLGAPEALANLEPRLTAVRQLLGISETIGEAQLESQGAFDRALRLRAAGWMSPLVQKLEVELTAEVVRHHELIDLPGAGVVGDPAARVAAQFVADEAEALVIVARNNGLTETIANVLEQTGVISKLLFGGHDGRSPIRVIVAITHLDDVAKTRFAEAMQRARMGGAKPDRSALFKDLAQEMQHVARQQLRSTLRLSPSLDDLSEESRGRRLAIIDQLVDDIRIVGVAANDYVNLEEGVDELAFVKDRAATGVPALVEGIQAIAQDSLAYRDACIATATRALAGILSDHLGALGTMYQEGGGRAVQEWDHFVAELRQEAGPLQEQLGLQHAAIRRRLRSEIVSELKALCDVAATQAGKTLKRLIGEGEKLHYQTLLAVLRRGGVFEKRKINFPDRLSLAMVDAIADGWEPRIIEAVRGAVRELAESDLALVERLCEAAQKIDERIVADAQVGAQAKILREQARCCVSFTRNRLDDLTQTIQARLNTAITDPIDRACDKAIRAGRHAGTGGKSEILAVLNEGGATAIEKAQDGAYDVLKGQYDTLMKELQNGFLSEFHDPIKSALDAMTADELAQARRSDAARRKKMIARFKALDDQVSAGLEQLPTNGEATPPAAAMVG